MCPPQSVVPEKSSLPRAFLTTSRIDLDEFIYDAALPAPPGLALSERAMSPPPGLALPDVLPPPGLSRSVREVCAWNFDKEFNALLTIASGICSRATIAMNILFPLSGPSMPPSQLGIAIADVDGCVYGVWNFNLSDDNANIIAEPCTDAMQGVGFDCQQFAMEGVSAKALILNLVNSKLVGAHAGSPLWVICDSYDVALFLNILSNGSGRESTFNADVANFFPNHVDLAQLVPSMSRNRISDARGELRNAGNDALAALELYSCLSVYSAPCSDNRKADEPLNVVIDTKREEKNSSSLEHDSSAKHHTSARNGPSIWCLKARRATTPTFVDQDAPTSLWASAAKQLAAEAVSLSILAAGPKRASGNKSSSASSRKVVITQAAVLWSDIVRGH